MRPPAWDSAGFASHHLGRHREALACYHRVLALHRTLGDRYHQSQTLVYLGEAQGGIGRPSAARNAWRQALTILEELHHPDVARVRSLLDVPAARQAGRDAALVAHAGC